MTEQTPKPHYLAALTGNGPQQPAMTHEQREISLAEKKLRFDTWAKTLPQREQRALEKDMVKKSVLMAVLTLKDERFAQLTLNGINLGKPAFDAICDAMAASAATEIARA